MGEIINPPDISPEKTIASPGKTNTLVITQEYSEDSNSEPDVDLENQYYNSKALKEDEPAAALLSFQKVLELEGGEKGEWGFKALKQMIKINFKLVSGLQNIAKSEQDTAGIALSILKVFQVKTDFF